MSTNKALTTTGNARGIARLDSLSGISKALVSIESQLPATKTLGAVVNLRDQAATLRHYVKESKQSLVVQNQAAHLKLLCERRAGDLLLKIPRVGPSQNAKKTNRHRDALFSEALKDAGIAEPTARRWQFLAKWPQRDLNALLTSCNKTQDELTTGLAVWAAREYINSQPEAVNKKKKKQAAAKNGKESDATENDRAGTKAENDRTGDDCSRPEKSDDVLLVPPGDTDADEQEQALIGRLQELFAEARLLCSGNPNLRTWAKTLSGWERKLSEWKIDPPVMVVGRS